MKKAVSIIGVFCILNASFISCKTHNMLSVSEVSEIKNPQKSLILHTPSKTYYLNNYKFTEKLLVGDLSEKIKIQTYKVHVHTKQNFSDDIDENTSQYCELLISNIDKITYSNVSIGKTFFLAVGVAFLAIFIVALTVDIPSTSISGGAK